MKVFTKMVMLFAIGLMCFGMAAQECSYDSYNRLINVSTILESQKKTK